MQDVAEKWHYGQARYAFYQYSHGQKMCNGNDSNFMYILLLFLRFLAVTISFVLMVKRNGNDSEDRHF